MTRIVLINMPFADWRKPSFALSQLAALTRREFPDVEVEVKYFNFDFANYLGVGTYDTIADNVGHLTTGVGEWLFRQVAFPEQNDNTDEYFNRYYPGAAWREFREHIADRRAGIATFCADLAVRHDLAGADIVGFTSMFAQHVASIGMARLVKNLNPRVWTVLGGANCEAPMGAVIAERVPEVDAVFSGPALHSFPEFVQHVLAGDPNEIHGITGVLTRQNAGTTRQPVGRDRDINDFFEPDYSGFVEAFTSHQERFAGAERAKPVLFFETSRGCWWGQRSHCTFCGLNGLGMDYRAMSPELALRQFDWLFSHSPWCEEFVCTDNIMPKSYPREVFAKLDTPPNASLFYEIKVPLAEHDMAVLAAAGVTRIQPGIESLATETLKLMNKGTTSFLNLQFLRSCVAHGISPVWNLLVGFPGEREEVYAKYVSDIPLLTHLPPPSGAHMVRFDRFSPYYTKAGEYGLDLTPMDFYGLVYPFDAEELARLAYFFADRNIAPYLRNAIKWLRPLNDGVSAWAAMWRDGEPPDLSLRREGGQHVVHDTRAGQPRTFPVDATLLPLLRRLSSPVRVDRLPGELGLPEAVVAAQLDFLREHGLVFTEGDRVMSLILQAPGTTDEPAETRATVRELPLVDVSGRR